MDCICPPAAAITCTCAHADCPSTPDYPDQASHPYPGLQQHSSPAPAMLAGATAAAAAADTTVAAIDPAMAAALHAYQSPLRRCTVAVKVRHAISIVATCLKCPLPCSALWNPCMRNSTWQRHGFHMPLQQLCVSCPACHYMCVLCCRASSTVCTLYQAPVLLQPEEAVCILWCVCFCTCVLADRWKPLR